MPTDLYMNEFQVRVEDVESDRTDGLAWGARYGLRLAGSAGELATHIHEALFEHGDFDDEYAASTCGDILWTLTAILSAMDIPLSDVAAQASRQHDPTASNPTIARVIGEVVS